MSRKIDHFKRKIANAIALSIANKRMGQRTAAALCGVSQARISNVVSGKLENFSIDSLVDIAERLGCMVSLDIIAADKALAMAQASLVPMDCEVDMNGFRDGCEDEFRFS